MVIEGKFNKIDKIYTDNLDNQIIGFYKKFCDIEQFKDMKVYLMPDVHPGKGCAIGSVIISKDIIIPGFVGVDIGCGVSCYILKKKKKLDLDEFDKAVRSQAKEDQRAKSLSNIFYPIQYRFGFDEENLFLNKRSCDRIYKKALDQLGTVGNGNHFIELDEYDDEHYILCIHSGSRGFGAAIAAHYMQKAYEECHKKYPDIPYEFAFFTSKRMLDNYMSEAMHAFDYAFYNRSVLANNIIDRCRKYFENDGYFDVPHNIITESDDGNFITRKGATPAYEGNRVVIPINMRDGILIGKVKEGREDWGYSLPHGMGRKYSRSEVLNMTTLNAVKKEMKDVYTTSLSKDVIDEAPVAYKPLDEVYPMISDILTDVKICKPVYNYKAH